MTFYPSYSTSRIDIDFEAVVRTVNNSKTWKVSVRIMALKANFNNISAISW